MTAKKSANGSPSNTTADKSRSWTKAELLSRPVKHIDIPASSRVPRPRTLRVRVGTPLNFEATANERSGWAEVAERLRCAVEELGAAGQRDRL